MQEIPLENKKPTQEKLDISVRMANKEDWPVCKELRLLSITGPDADMLGLTLEKKQEEMNKTDTEWELETSSDTMFSVLACNNSQAIGLGRAMQEEEGVWRIRNGYVKPAFRDMGIQQKMLALRLSEIMKLGGFKAVTGIKINNPISFHNAEKFGFKEVDPARKAIALGPLASKWHMLESDLTDPAVIKKINEVLDAR